MQIKIAAPLGGDAIIEFDDNEEVSGRLSIISGDITEDMIAEAIAGANPNSYMGFVNTLDAPASDVLRTLHLYAGWFVDWPAVDGGDEFGGDTWTQTDVFMTQRATGVATYRNNDFFGLVDGLNFALQYQGKNDSAAKVNNWKGRDVVESNGDGFGLSATYDYEGFGVGATYAKSDRTDGQVSYAKKDPLNASGKTAEVWATGLKYDANNIYLAATYSETQNMTVFGDDFIANKAKNFEAVAQYQFDFGLRPSIAYLHSRGENIGAFGSQDLVEYIDLGATYYFNKNMSAFVDYKINLIDESEFTKRSEVATDNIVAVGMTYQF